MFILKIRTDNAAFDNDPAVEIMRILDLAKRKVECELDNERNGWDFRDTNGNLVGSITWRP